MTSRLLPALFLLAPLVSAAAFSQVEGAVPTQALIRSESKDGVLPAAAALTLKLDEHATPITSLTPIRPADTQIALLIDDGLTRNAGIQLNDLRSFATSLPPTTELLVGYMSNGRVEVVVPFTTDHADAATKIRVPFGIPGQSASPYFCLSDFVKHWPGSGVSEEPGGPGSGESAARKARFVMMITNGVDPYNGSTSLLNQDSPYVQTAIADSQRAGVAVSSIYYRDAGFRGGSSAISGQDYLQQVAQATGGESYYQGLINPVTLTPFFKEFVHDLSETYVATFPANVAGGGREHLVRLQFKSTGPKIKLRYPDAVRPGIRE